MRFLSALITLVPLAALASPIASSDPTFAPLYKEGQHIEDNYIVVLKKGVNLADLQLHLMDIEQAHAASVSPR